MLNPFSIGQQIITLTLKKRVFFPTHKNQYLSLMVIVHVCLVDHLDELDAAYEIPCMLHLDGLSLHNRRL